MIYNITNGIIDHGRKSFLIIDIWNILVLAELRIIYLSSTKVPLLKEFKNFKIKTEIKS